MRFRITYLDGTETEVLRTASALRAFERTHNKSLFEVVGSGQSWWADELAHHSLCQTTDESRDLDAWLDAVQSITWAAPEKVIAQIAQMLSAHVDETAVDPTPGAGSTSRSGSSKPRSSRAKASKV